MGGVGARLAMLACGLARLSAGMVVGFSGVVFGAAGLACSWLEFRRAGDELPAWWRPTAHAARVADGSLFAGELVIDFSWCPSSPESRAHRRLPGRCRRRPRVVAPRNSLRPAPEAGWIRSAGWRSPRAVTAARESRVWASEWRPSSSPARRTSWPSAPTWLRIAELPDVTATRSSTSVPGSIAIDPLQSTQELLRAALLAGRARRGALETRGEDSAILDTLAEVHFAARPTPSGPSPSSTRPSPSRPSSATTATTREQRTPLHRRARPRRPAGGPERCPPGSASSRSLRPCRRRRPSSAADPVRAVAGRRLRSVSELVPVLGQVRVGARRRPPGSTMSPVEAVVPRRWVTCTVVDRRRPQSYQRQGGVRRPCMRDEAHLVERGVQGAPGGARSPGIGGDLEPRLGEPPASVGTKKPSWTRVCPRRVRTPTRADVVPSRRAAHHQAAVARATRSGRRRPACGPPGRAPGARRESSPSCSSSKPPSRSPGPRSPDRRGPSPEPSASTPRGGARDAWTTRRGARPGRRGAGRTDQLGSGCVAPVQPARRRAGRRGPPCSGEAGWSGSTVSRLGHGDAWPDAGIRPTPSRPASTSTDLLRERPPPWHGPAEDDGLVAVHEHPIVQVPAHGTREHRCARGRAPCGRDPSTLSWWEARITSCSMIGPSSRSLVA